MGIIVIISLLPQLLVITVIDDIRVDCCELGCFFMFKFDRLVHLLLFLALDDGL